jgi:tetratricopeptide (TPR) repeat protein
MILRIQAGDSRYSNASSLNDLIKSVKQYYSLNDIEPIVSVEGNEVIVNIQEDRITKVEDKYDLAIKLCQKSEYTPAIKIFEEVLGEVKDSSEAYRNYGQALIESGNIDAGIDKLIEALKIDPTNVWALIMMGNTYVKYKNDTDTAMHYFNTALENNPTNHIAYNNIAGNLLKLGKYEEAQKLFEKAIELNDSYSNSYLGLGFCLYERKMYLPTFNAAEKALKLSDALIAPEALNLMLKSANEFIKTIEWKPIINRFKSELEKRGGVSVVLEERPNLSTIAQMQLAWNHGWTEHKLVYRTSDIFLPHLMLHELVHLLFAIEDKEEKSYEIFETTLENKQQFFRDYMPLLKKKNPMFNDNEGRLKETMESLLNGICLQLFNCTTDMFVEDYIYEHFPEFRPVQFLSLMKMGTDNANSSNDKNTIKYFPNRIVEINRIMNIATVSFPDLTIHFI